MTSSACICEPGFRNRIKYMQIAYQNAREFFQKIVGQALVPGFGTKQFLKFRNLNYYFDFFCFIL